MRTPEFVAFGPNDTFVISSDDHVYWSRYLPNDLFNVLNGRYNNIGQWNSPVKTLAYNNNQFIMSFKNGNIKFCGMDYWLCEILDETQGNFDFISLGSDTCDGHTSYIFNDGEQVCWRNLPFRMQQLIQSRTQYSLEWASLGHKGAWILKYSDGAIFWNNLSECLEKSLRASRRIDRVYLDPFTRENYFLVFSDGGMEWFGPCRLTNIVNSSYNMNARDILYSNTSIAGTFSCGRSLDHAIVSLRCGFIHPADIPAMRVVKYRGATWSLDNRRLYVFSQADCRDVPVIEESIKSDNLRHKLGRIDGTRIFVRN